MVLVSGSTKMPRLTALKIPVRVFRVVRGERKPRNTPTTRTKAAKMRWTGFPGANTVAAMNWNGQQTSCPASLVLSEANYYE